MDLFRVFTIRKWNKYHDQLIYDLGESVESFHPILKSIVQKALYATLEINNVLVGPNRNTKLILDKKGIDKYSKNIDEIKGKELVLSMFKLILQTFTSDPTTGSIIKPFCELSYFLISKKVIELDDNEDRSKELLLLRMNEYCQVLKIDFNNDPGMKLYFLTLIELGENLIDSIKDDVGDELLKFVDYNKNHDGGLFICPNCYNDYVIGLNDDECGECGYVYKEHNYFDWVTHKGSLSFSETK